MNLDRKAGLVRQRNSVRLAFGASVSLVAGSLAIVAGTMAPAQAADPVKINLVGINDFHGRIDANTVKWAGTVKKLQYDTPGIPSANSLIVGAGDLIGASVFASAVANDQPTIDVMNDIEPGRLGGRQPRVRQGLGGPARPGHRPGRHDQRALGLPGRERLQEGHHARRCCPSTHRKTIDGVARRGHRRRHAGDAEPGQPRRDHRPRLRRPHRGRQPGGRPAQRRQRRQRRGRRAGGHASTPGSNVTTSYPEALAAGGEFAKMATLDPHIDAIFNGHTHQKYVFNQPVTGGDLPTRPMVQTGSVRRQRRPDRAHLRQGHRQGDRQPRPATRRGSPRVTRT